MGDLELIGYVFMLVSGAIFLWHFSFFLWV